MKALINHLLHSNIAEIQAKSIRNCHCLGVHSIMLLEAPAKTIRLYVTDSNHGLWLNRSPFTRQTIAFHDHHCDLTLHCVKGSFTDLRIFLPRDRQAPVQMSNACSLAFKGMPLQSYRYKSKICAGEMNFEVIGNVWPTSYETKAVGAGESIHLKSFHIHSVFCERGTINAWLVYEGPEDDRYESICYSANDPNTLKHPDLYQPMDKADVWHYVELAGLL